MLLMPRHPGVSGAQTGHQNTKSYRNHTNYLWALILLNQGTHVEKDDLLNDPEFLTLYPQILTIFIQHQWIFLLKPTARTQRAQALVPSFSQACDHCTGTSCVRTSKSLGWNMFRMITTFSCLIRFSPFFSGLQSSCLQKQRYSQQKPNGFITCLSLKIIMYENVLLLLL